MTAPRHFLLVPCAVLAACAAPPPARQRPPPVGVRASARPNPKNPIGAMVDVVAPGSVRARIEHGDTTVYGERTPDVALSASGAATIPIIGLSPNTATHLRAVATTEDGAEARSPDVVFGAGSLPVGVPASITVTTSTAGLEGYVLAGLYDEPKSSFVATMIDRKGRVRWFWAPPGKTMGPAHFDRVRGNFLVMDAGDDAFCELDLAGDVKKRWHDTASRDGIDGHDFQLLPNGNALMLGWEYRSVDSRPLFPNGAKDSIRADHTIDEIDEAGAVKFHWSSYDHIGLDEVLVGPNFDPTNFHVVHANSVEVLPDGNLIASFRTTSSIVKIDRQTGRVVWRLGGKKSDFSFVDDPFSGFSQQHDPHFLKDGELLLFDNGNQHEPRVSRVVRYRLDESARTARLTWEYRHAPDVFSPIAGSARMLPSGNVLIAWAHGLITEVDESKRVVWEASTVPLALYRALYAPSLYPDEFATDKKHRLSRPFPIE
jgi:hypothetical protein